MAEAKESFTNLAERREEKVNTFINRAIDETMARDARAGGDLK